MSFDFYLVIFIVVLLWVYGLYNLYNGRKIKYPVEGDNNVAVYAIYFIMAALIFIKNFNFFGVLMSALVILSGLLYGAVPSGFSDDAIYIRGRKFLFTKIKNMEISKDSSKIRLVFEYNHRPYFLMDSDKNILNDCKNLYMKGRNKL